MSLLCREFVMFTGGAIPEIDRIGIILEVLKDADQAERSRILQYVLSWNMDLRASKETGDRT